VWYEVCRKQCSIAKIEIKKGRTNGAHAHKHPLSSNMPPTCTMDGPQEGGGMHAHQVIQPKVDPTAALRVHPSEQLVQGIAWAEAPRAPPSIWQPDYARRYAPLTRRRLRQQRGCAFLQNYASPQARGL